MPFLNQRRYFMRAAQSKRDPFTYLQQAMWMLAASMGTQFQYIQPALYSHTRSKLEKWDLDTLGPSVAVEQIQTWILLATYEIIHVNSDRGWISAGRCFRLVHLMRLHEIDNPRAWSEPQYVNLTWVEIEERRRTFWTAYCLDRHANFIRQLPLSLNEQLVRLAQLKPTNIILSYADGT